MGVRPCMNRVELVRVTDLQVLTTHLVPAGVVFVRDDGDYRVRDESVEVWSCLVPQDAELAEPERDAPMLITLTMIGNPNDDGARYNATTVIECASADDAEFAGRDFARFFHALQKGMNQYWLSTGGE